MIHVFHTPTGWKVCQEHPQEPPFMKPKEWNQAVALSIANAVDVRDQDWVKRKVFFRGNYFPLPDMEESEQELKDWKPDDNQVYALPDLDVEIKLQGRPKGSKKWMDESNLISPVSNWESRKLAHVFRKKEEPKMKEKMKSRVDKINYKRVEEEAYWLAKQKSEELFIDAIRYLRFVKYLASKDIIVAPENQSPPPDIEESQDDLWTEVAYNFSMVREFKDAYKTLQSKFHLTRVKAELKGEKK